MLKDKKENTMKTMLFLVAIISLTVCTVHNLEAEPIPVYISNLTSEPIIGMWARQVGSTTWESIVLRGQSIPDLFVSTGSHPGYLASDESGFTYGLHVNTFYHAILARDVKGNFYAIESVDLRDYIDGPYFHLAFTIRHKVEKVYVFRR